MTTLTLSAIGGATGATGATDAQDLAGYIQYAYRRWIAFHSDYEEAESGLLTLWTMHTHVFDIAAFTPYLLITAPTSEAGKSRIFDVARLLVRKAFPVVDPTPAALFTAIDLLEPTMLMDEADMLREHAQLRAILNAGVQPGTPVIRVKKSYNVFCPKAFSGISGVKPPLTEATLSRCIQVPMRRKSPGERVDPFRLRDAVDECSPLHAWLEEWAKEARDALAEAEPDRPPGLTDRQWDAWEPLIAIADLIGGDWPGDARKWAVTLSEAVPKPPDPAVQILADCKRVLDAHPGDRIATRTLADLRNALEVRDYDEELSPMQLGRRLSGFDIHCNHSPFRTGGKKSPSMRGYTFRSKGKYRPEWEDAFLRYGVS